MPAPESDSSIPLPGERQQSLPSSPPFEFDAFTNMSDANNDQAPKAEPSETEPNAGETQSPTNQRDSREEDRPPSGQQAQQAPIVDTPEIKEDGDMDSDEDVDPADQIDDFDWNDLHEKYHIAMNKASAQEQALMQEFAQLMDVL